MLDPLAEVGNEGDAGSQGEQKGGGYDHGERCPSLARFCLGGLLGGLLSHSAVFGRGVTYAVEDSPATRSIAPPTMIEDDTMTAVTHG